VVIGVAFVAEWPPVEEEEAKGNVEVEFVIVVAVTL
jgi:hypothetical protein